MKFFNRVRVSTPTIGQGTLTLGSAAGANMLTLAEAGAADGDETTFLIEEGADFEISRGIVGGSATTITRATVLVSKINGTPGTSKLELSGAGQVRFIQSAEDINDLVSAAPFWQKLPETVKTDNYTLTKADAGVALIFNKGTAITGSLPAVANSTGEIYIVRCLGAGALAIDPDGSETIEGSATLTLPTGGAAYVWPNEGKTAWRASVFLPSTPSAARSALGATTVGNAVFTAADAAAARTALAVPTGTAGAVLPFLNGNNTFSGTNTFATGQFNASAQSGTFSATGATRGILISSYGLIQSSLEFAGTGGHYRFYNTNGQVGSISTAASATAFNTTSDETLKNFIGPFDPSEALAIIRADPARKFSWKMDGALAVGWGAQTSYAVSPDLATPGGWFDKTMGLPCDEHDENAEYLPWGVDQGKRTPYLWAVVPWLADRLDMAEATIAALESRIAALEAA